MILPLPLCSPQCPLLLNNLSLQEGTALPLPLLLPELEQIPEFSWTMQVIGYTLSLPMFACLLLFSLLLLAAFNFGKPVLKRTVTKTKIRVWVLEMAQLVKALAASLVT